MTMMMRRNMRKTLVFPLSKLCARKYSVIFYNFPLKKYVQTPMYSANIIYTNKLKVNYSNRSPRFRPFLLVFQRSGGLDERLAAEIGEGVSGSSNNSRTLNSDENAVSCMILPLSLASRLAATRSSQYCSGSRKDVWNHRRNIICLIPRPVELKTRSITSPSTSVLTPKKSNIISVSASES